MASNEEIQVLQMISRQLTEIKEILEVIAKGVQAWGERFTSISRRTTLISSNTSSLDYQSIRLASPPYIDRM